MKILFPEKQWNPVEIPFPETKAPTGVVITVTIVLLCTESQTGGHQGLKNNRKEGRTDRHLKPEVVIYIFIGTFLTNQLKVKGIIYRAIKTRRLTWD